MPPWTGGEGGKPEPHGTREAESAEDPSDRALMLRLAGGDREALAPLMERYYQRLYRVALAYVRQPDEALDVVQETFVKAFQNARTWDASAAVGPWLVRVAVNQSIDHYRRTRRRRATFEPLADGDHDAHVDSGQPSPERQVLGREVSERIGQALRVLPEKQRAVFVLRHYDDMTLEEIASTLTLSLGTVKSSLHRATFRLRVQLGSLRS